MSYSDIVVKVGPIVVGAVFLFAAALKVAAPVRFREQIAALGLLPRRMLDWLVPLAIGGEAALGVSLMVRLSPHVMLPATTMLIFALSGLTIWSFRTGRADDCGCYGDLFVLSIRNSILLNVLYLILIEGAWFFGRSALEPDSAWKVYSTAGALLSFSVAAILKTRVAPQQKRTPLALGALFDPRWAGGKLHAGDEILVSYLGTKCPHCRVWVRVLNAIHAIPTLPSVVGVISASSGDAETFGLENGIRFPLRRISQLTMNRLVAAVPTTIALRAAVVEEIWIGSPSTAFYYRFQRAFFETRELNKSNEKD